MNFSVLLKRELTSVPLRRDCCKLAFFSALVHVAGSLSLSRAGISLEIATRSEDVMQYLVRTLAGLSVQHEDLLLGESGGVRNLKFSQATSEALLLKLGILTGTGAERHVQREMLPDLIQSPCCRRSFVKGAFLGCGSVKINASSGYHLEFFISNPSFCAQLAGILNGEGFRFKYAERAEHGVLYLKDGEEISDFLAYLGASKSVLDLQDLLLARRLKNADNRKNNCYLANVDKSFDASIRQVEDISAIERGLGLAELEPDLRRTCEQRLDHPEWTMAELADALGISKSGLNHRFRRLREIADAIRARERESEGENEKST